MQELPTVLATNYACFVICQQICQLTTFVLLSAKKCNVCIRFCHLPYRDVNVQLDVLVVGGLIPELLAHGGVEAGGDLLVFGGEIDGLFGEGMADFLGSSEPHAATAYGDRRDFTRVCFQLGQADGGAGEKTIRTIHSPPAKDEIRRAAWGVSDFPAATEGPSSGGEGGSRFCLNLIIKPGPGGVRP